METVVRVLPFGVIELTLILTPPAVAREVRPPQERGQQIRLLDRTTAQTQIVSVPPPTYSFFADDAVTSFGQSVR
jgi:hypothetical protein